MPHPRGHGCNKAHYRGVAVVTHQWAIMPVSCMANHAITAHHATQSVLHGSKPWWAGKYLLYAWSSLTFAADVTVRNTCTYYLVSPTGHITCHCNLAFTVTAWQLTAVAGTLVCVVKVCEQFDAYTLSMLMLAPMLAPMLASSRGNQFLVHLHLLSYPFINLQARIHYSTQGEY